MSEPQASIFSEGSARAYFLEFSISDQAPIEDVRRAILGSLQAPTAPLGTEPVAVDVVFAFSTPLGGSYRHAPNAEPLAALGARAVGSS